jgi:hypothetical protein
MDEGRGKPGPYRLTNYSSSVAYGANALPKRKNEIAKIPSQFFIATSFFISMYL